jgi:predicted RNA-binding Zn-ribbon protein involved in translation (DUF1610 family)
MSSAHEEIVRQARERGRYGCPKCKYSLSGVPADKEGRLLCPECGFAMRFVIDVRLARGDDEEIRTRDSKLRMGDRAMILVTICVLLILAISVVLSIVL